MLNEMTLNRISTGIEGLDEILSGGLIAQQAYLIKGQPGSGKTTLGLHFLNAGISQGETSLFISFSEPEFRLRRNAKLLDIDIDRVEFLDLSPTADFFTEDQTYDIFSPAEVDRAPMTQKIIEAIDKIKPQRIFLDAITQFRFLSSDTFQFRKQIQSFLRYMLDRDITLLFTSEGSDRNPDDDLQFMSDGVIELHTTPERRSIRVAKFRGSGFVKGYHELELRDRGMTVFPSLIPETHQRKFTSEAISSGVAEIDELLHGGIERGTTTIISGPSGVGKSTFGMQFMKEAAGRGERSVLYAFEEAEETLLTRCQAVNIPAHVMIDRGTLSVVKVDPLKYTPNQFVHLVRAEVEQNNARILMIDSTSGYRLSMQGEDLVRQLHSLCQYLKNMGVTVILINEVHTIAGGEFSVTDVGLSYLADNLIFLRYLELEGELRKAIGVLKKRVSDFERTLREFHITKYGIKVGEPLTKLRGILSGIPEWIDRDKDK
ncbi:KaiC protein [Hyella patelloides LEGE 07179]|uniref:non-specific serine/threonine protein kinase n=1 Tax=Hyella patelloides LEGE 07179 TaxID=945734 RepID=A0A563VYW4_9CYAN|nr:ATPase domain-containing protein [Hyella patelloides]VEP16644.1 KaiC protein [Hyella patelloides LEGE 07179]